MHEEGVAHNTCNMMIQGRTGRAHMWHPKSTGFAGRFLIPITAKRMAMHPRTYFWAVGASFGKTWCLLGGLSQNVGAHFWLTRAVTAASGTHDVAPRSKKPDLACCSCCFLCVLTPLFRVLQSKYASY